MKVIIFTKGDGPEMREARDRGKELEEENLEVEYCDVETPDGSEKAALYDIYSTPSFLVAKDDGSIISLWRGAVPLKSDIEYIARS